MGATAFILLGMAGIICASAAVSASSLIDDADDEMM
jgi:hypothetical protein